MNKFWSLFIGFSMLCTAVFGQATSNSPVCEGGIIQLGTSAPSTSGYQWSGPAFSSAQQNPQISGATPANSGTYTVTVTQGGVPKTFSVNVLVNPTPTAPVVNMDYSGCAGTRLVVTPGNYDPSLDYIWSGPQNSTTDSLIINTLSGSVQGNYTVSAKLGNCTGPSVTFRIDSYTKPPMPTISSGTKFCEGQTVIFTTSNTGSSVSHWSGPNSFNSTDPSPSIPDATSALNGTYSVYFSIGNCDGPPASKAITVQALPATPAITGKTQYCIGEVLSLTTTSTATTYQWNGPSGPPVNAKTLSISNLTPSQQGDYRLKVSDGICFSKDALVFVSVSVPPVIDSIVLNKDSLCEGDELQLTAATTASNLKYEWGGPERFSDSLPTAILKDTKIINSGNYTLIIEQLGCKSALSSKNVSIKPTPPLPGLKTNAPVCEETPLLIETNSIDSTVNYKWYGPNGNFISDSIVVDTSASLDDMGNYTFTVDFGGCTSKRDTIYVRIKERIKDFFPIAPDSICQNEALTLEMAQYEEAEYIWTGPNRFLEYTQRAIKPFIQPLDSGFYRAVAQNTCNRRDTSIFVKVKSIPVVDILGDTSVCDYESIILTAVGPAYESYLWNTGDTLPQIEITEPKNLALQVTNISGCKNIFYKTIYYRCFPELYIPTAFTPDEDNLNDRLFVIGHNISEFKMELYARNGNKVYYSEDINEGWDGTDNGKTLQPGYYYYEIKYKTFYKNIIHEDRVSGRLMMIK